jgi:drug/metabolite transporter (DMT)-like permease
LLNDGHRSSRRSDDTRLLRRVKRFVTSTPILIGCLWAIWSSAFIAIKIGLNEATPSAFTLLRLVSALVASGVVLMLSPASRSELTSLPAHRVGAVLGLTNMAGFTILHTLGLKTADVGIGSALVYTQPLLVALGAAWLLKERLTVRQTLGLVAGWAGVFLIVGGELDVGRTSLRAILFLLWSAALWALGTLAFKRIGMVASPWAIVFLACAYGLPPVLVFASLTDTEVHLSGTLLVTVLWAALGIVGGYGLQFILLSRGKAGVVSSWIFPVPVLAALLGVLVLDEVLRIELVIGASAVALGIYLVNVQASGTP